MNEQIKENIKSKIESFDISKTFIQGKKILVPVKKWVSKKYQNENQIKNLIVRNIKKVNNVIECERLVEENVEIEWIRRFFEFEFTFNKDNFFLNSQAEFVECEIPNCECDYESASGSQYYYSKIGVVRVSDHWGERIASCNWELSNKSFEAKAGFCAWEDFNINYIK